MLDRLSFASVTRTVGDAWILRVLSTGDDGPPGDAPTMVVTDPAGLSSSVTVEETTCPGVYTGVHIVDVAGRWTAQAILAPYRAYFVAEAYDVVDGSTGNELPTHEDVTAYMGPHSYTDQQVSDMLAQERAAQFNVCRVPAAYPPDLRGALLRRTQRALAMLHLALAVKETVEGESQVIVPGRDPEVRRLEAPYRKVTVG
jgi:hypothetical protein